MSTRRSTWVRRLADVSGVGYAGMSDADRRRIPGHDAVPKVLKLRDGSEFLEWGNGSQTPAQAYELVDPDAPTKRVLSHLMELLELPGVPSDYHFAIQNVISQLMRRRLTEPEVLDDVEGLCLLNMALVEAIPEAVARDWEGDLSKGFVGMFCFSTLITLYEEEGALDDALAIAHRAKPFGNNEGAEERLEARLAAVRAEDEA